MFQGLRQRRLFDIGAGPGPERSAGCGDDDANQFLAIAGTERLKQRIMFGIGGQDAGAGLGRALHEKITGANQAFLVRQRDGGAAIDRGQSRFQPGGAADGGHDPIRRPGGRFDDRALACPALGSGPGQGVLQIFQQIGVGNGGEAGVEFLRQLGQCGDVGIGGQRLDLIALRRPPQQVHRAVADRAGGTEDGHGSHGRYRGFVVTQRNCAHIFTKP